MTWYAWALVGTYAIRVPIYIATIGHSVKITKSQAVGQVLHSALATWAVIALAAT